MEWRLINGYKYPYRINTEGRVQVCKDMLWRSVKTKFRTRRGRTIVKLRKRNGEQAEVLVADLMAAAFLGGKRNGYTVRYLDGSPRNVSLQNLELVQGGRPPGRARGSTMRPVNRLDRNGDVVATYRSISEAARKNYLSCSAVLSRCRREVKCPYALDGHTYQFAEEANSIDQRPGHRP